jgi:hypothetical protein
LAALGAGLPRSGRLPHQTDLLGITVLIGPTYEHRRTNGAGVLFSILSCPVPARGHAMHPALSAFRAGLLHTGGQPHQTDLLGITVIKDQPNTS